MSQAESNSIPRCAAADPNPKKPGITPPAGSCDCHAHIFGPESLYPYMPNRSYTPPAASLSRYITLLDTLGLERSVIVQPSVYGTDNRVTLDAVKKRRGNFRGVVVVDDRVTSKELIRMHEIGIRGVRFNLLFKGGISLSAVCRIADRIKTFGWHLQFLVDVSSFPELDTLKKLPVDIVFDHMGHLPATKGVNDPGFVSLLNMLNSGKAWVKMSGPYRISCTGDYPYQDVTPFAKKIIEVNPERAVWATDWPHPAIQTAMPNDGDLLDLFYEWVPTAEMRKDVLVDNPSKLYGFDDHA